MSTSTVVKKVKVTNEDLVKQYAPQRSVTVVPLSKMADNARAEVERSHQRELEYVEERIAQMAKLRQAMMILDSIPEVSLNVSAWNESYFTLKLGFIPHVRAATRQLADTLRAIRKALGCSLGKPAMDLEDGDAKVVSFTFSPVEWPGVYIKFYRRMPRASKCRCRIVTERLITKRLVCEVTPR